MNGFPSLKHFIQEAEHAGSYYPDLEIKYISGHNPDLVIYQDDGKSEIERIDLTKYDTQGKQQVDPGKVEALHTLLKSKGFKRGDWFLAQYFPMNTVNQFIKFTTIKTRYHSANNNMVQVAAFEFVDAGTLVKPIIAKNAGGDSPRDEGPEKLIDGTLRSKWLDKNAQPVIFDFGAPKKIDGYRWATGTDKNSLGRDPVQWKIEGSDNGFEWTELHIQSTDYDVPHERQKWVIGNPRRYKKDEL